MRISAESPATQVAHCDAALSGQAAFIVSAPRRNSISIVASLANESTVTGTNGIASTVADEAALAAITACVYANSSGFMQVAGELQGRLLTTTPSVSQHQ